MNTAQAVVIAIAGAAIVSLIVTIILARLALHRWDREVERQKKTASLLLENQTEVAAKAVEVADALRESNERIAVAVVQTTTQTHSKLDVIHVLVNSQMTAALQSELDATVAQLALMSEVVSLKRSAGHEPSREALAALDATKARVKDLRETIAERERHDKLADERDA